MPSTAPSPLQPPRRRRRRGLAPHRLSPRHPVRAGARGRARGRRLPGRLPPAEPGAAHPQRRRPQPRPRAGPGLTEPLDAPRFAGEVFAVVALALAVLLAIELAAGLAVLALAPGLAGDALTLDLATLYTRLAFPLVAGVTLASIVGAALEPPPALSRLDARASRPTPRSSWSSSSSRDRACRPRPRRLAGSRERRGPSSARRRRRGLQGRRCPDPPRAPALVALFTETPRQGRPDAGRGRLGAAHRPRRHAGRVLHALGPLVAPLCRPAGAAAPRPDRRRHLDRAPAGMGGPFSRKGTATASRPPRTGRSRPGSSSPVRPPAR